MEGIFVNETRRGLCEKIIMMRFNRSRIKHPVQEPILHNKNITESIWTKHETIKLRNNPQRFLLFSRH